ncbi:hypothetical protein [Perlucidibaca aquatica]|uniref:hypothetical protein n=1 Tax=Perlucidibaca aquatica TaxID=1852776 RepID=UPI00083B5759|nr:hypothetical protein [Perlucidibaca aquatica]
MQTTSLYESAKKFFSEFNAAFSTFDGNVVATRYAAPYLAVRGDGTSESFVSREDIADYFQNVLDKYHRTGCRSCRHKDLNIVAVGSGAVFATVTWELLGSDGHVVITWRESYNLVWSLGELKACASMDHAL